MNIENFRFENLYMKKYLGFFLAVFYSIILNAQNGNPDRPNILWIVSEDNTTLLGCYGDKIATTPNIDRLASGGILYENAFCTAPVCAPARSTLITGMYPAALGTENMRSDYPIPQFVKFFPYYLREAGYYTSNCAKKDYNTIDQPNAWDESGNKATYKNRKPGQPFFAVFNIGISHESSIHNYVIDLRHDPESVTLPAYQPATPEMKHDWAQYYDKLEDMDKEVGRLLKELNDQGLSDNTIVFYYGDNGGVLPRSKRFMYESGLHVPLIIRIPEKYAHLAPYLNGTKTDQIVTFVDFAPTVLSLAEVKIPQYMQGHAFLGKQRSEKQRYGFAFRGRMDERIDLIRSVRDKRYRYIRNYYPNKIYAQYIEYLWRAPSMKSWDSAYKTGTLNEVQSRFFRSKPVEELYDCGKDPDNVNNLADKKEYQDVLKRLRAATRDWLIVSRDAGFIPEARKEELSKTTTIYEYAHSVSYPVKKVIETAEMASSKEAEFLDELIRRLQDQDPDVRYWAATGCIILGQAAMRSKEFLNKLLTDRESSVRIAAAEALYILGEKKKALNILVNELEGSNLMARVQALNVLENADKKDVSAVIPQLRSIIAEKHSGYDYDVRAAKRLLYDTTDAHF